MRKRSFKNFKSEDFVKSVREVSWFVLYLFEDPTQAANLLTKKLTDILDTMAPIRTIQVRSKYAAWLSDQTKNLLKQRDSAQATAAHTRNPDDWSAYKHLRNTATSKMRGEKKAWEQHKLDNKEHNSSTLWQNVKSWLNWGSSGPPSKLFHNGIMVTKPTRLATTMNEFFTNKVIQLRQNIPAAISDPLYKLKTVMSDRQCSFRAVPPSEVSEEFQIHRYGLYRHLGCKACFSRDLTSYYPHSEHLHNTFSVSVAMEGSQDNSTIKKGRFSFG